MTADEQEIRQGDRMADWGHLRQQSVNSTCALERLTRLGDAWALTKLRTRCFLFLEEIMRNDTHLSAHCD